MRLGGILAAGGAVLSLVVLSACSPANQGTGEKPEAMAGAVRPSSDGAELVPYTPPEARVDLKEVSGVVKVIEAFPDNTSLEVLVEGGGPGSAPGSVARTVQELSETLKANPALIKAPQVTLMVALAEDGSATPLFDLSFRSQDLQKGGLQDLRGDEVLETFSKLGFMSTPGQQGLNFWCKEAPRAPRLCREARRKN